MRSLGRDFLRTAQTMLPWDSDTKAFIQHHLRRVVRRPFEPDFNALRLLLGPSPVCLDVGANRGQSIHALQLTCVAPFIHAFEPNPRLAAQLPAGRLSRADVTVHAYGLSDAAGTFDLWVPSYNDFLFDGLASLDRHNAEDWLRSRILCFNDRRLRMHRIECEVRVLDDCLSLDQLDFVKVDVQGSERAVLRGALGTLERFRPVVMTEAPSASVRHLMDSLGYSELHFSRGSLRPGPGDLNSIFIAR